MKTNADSLVDHRERHHCWLMGSSLHHKGLRRGASQNPATNNDPRRRRSAVDHKEGLHGGNRPDHAVRVEVGPAPIGLKRLRTHCVPRSRPRRKAKQGLPCSRTVIASLCQGGLFPRQCSSRRAVFDRSWDRSSGGPTAKPCPNVESAPGLPASVKPAGSPGQPRHRCAGAVTTGRNRIERLARTSPRIRSSGMSAGIRASGKPAHALLEARGLRGDRFSRGPPHVIRPFRIGPGRADRCHPARANRIVVIHQSSTALVGKVA